MAERNASDGQGEGWRSDLSTDLGSWVLPRRIDASYYEAVGTVEDLRGYVASDQFLTDIERGLEVSKEPDEPPTSADVEKADSDDPESSA
jgi:hypothetical protein